MPRVLNKSDEEVNLFEEIVVDKKKTPARVSFEIYNIVKNSLFLKNKKGEERRVSSLDYPGKGIGDSIDL